MTETEKLLIAVSQTIGTIAGSNCHFTAGLAAKIEQAGKPIGALTVDALIGHITEYKAVYNRAHS